MDHNPTGSKVHSDFLQQPCAQWGAALRVGEVSEVGGKAVAPHSTSPQSLGTSGLLDVYNILRIRDNGLLPAGIV